mmetsp:Transcript_18087/g.68581  ORF Transcript_18087/g.68581 Transcript_18087/m.68581 type:complete len:255 (+) Transcript_18087:1035-1799(+)
MCEHRRRAGGLRSAGRPAGVPAQLLGAPHGAGPPQLPAGRRGDHGNREQDRRRGHHLEDRRGPEGRVRAVPEDGHGDRRQHHPEPGGRGHHRASGRAADGRRPVRLPGADERGHVGHAQWLRDRRERLGHAGAAVPAADLRHHQVALEQRLVRCAHAGRGPHREDRFVRQAVWRGEVAPVPRPDSLRVPGRRVSGRAGLDLGRPEEHRERGRYEPDDAADPRTAPSADADSEEPPREGAGELHRPGGTDRRSRR